MFYLGSSSFSVYEEMSRQLLSHFYTSEALTTIAPSAASSPSCAATAVTGVASGPSTGVGEVSLPQGHPTPGSSSSSLGAWRYSSPGGEKEGRTGTEKREYHEKNTTVEKGSEEEISPHPIGKEEETKKENGEEEKEKFATSPTKEETSTREADLQHSLLFPTPFPSSGGESPSAIKWAKRTSKAHLLRCDLVLGDRFDISYAALRCAPLSSQGIFRGIRWVNYFQGSDALTLKASMTLLLKKEESPAWLARYFPLSFVLGGDVGKRKDEREAFLAAVKQEEEAAATGSVEYEGGSEVRGGEHELGGAETCEKGAVDSVPLVASTTTTATCRLSLPWWILKPSAGAKGAGISILQGVAEVQAFIDHQLTEEYQKSGSKAPRWMAQSYVLRPLLLPGRRKFDIRIWVLLQSPYTIYAYSKGSCRTTSVAYDARDPSNVLSHLTNHCLQEGAEGFGQYEEGNEMFFPSLSAFLSRLKNVDGHYVYPDDEKEGWKGKGPTTEGEEHQEDQCNSTSHATPVPCTSKGTTVEDRRDGETSSFSLLSQVIWPQIVSIVTRTLLMLKDRLQLLPTDEAEAFRCFQLFGYDFMLDDTLQVKLLEINGSPGLAQRYLSPVVRELIQRLYAGSFSSSSSTLEEDNNMKKSSVSVENTTEEQFMKSFKSSHPESDGVTYPLLHPFPREKGTLPTKRGEGIEKRREGSPKTVHTIEEEEAARRTCDKTLLETSPSPASHASPSPLIAGVEEKEREKIKEGEEWNQWEEKGNVCGPPVAPEKEDPALRGKKKREILPSIPTAGTGAAAGASFPPPFSPVSTGWLSDREWSLEKDQFVLLWKEGEDPLPTRQTT